MAAFEVDVELSSVFQLSKGAHRRGVKFNAQLTSSEFERCSGVLHETLRQNSVQDGTLLKYRGASWAGALFKDFVDAAAIPGTKSQPRQRLVLTNDMNMHPLRRHSTYQQLLSKYVSERKLDGPTLGEQMKTQAERRVIAVDNFDDLGFEVEMGTWSEPFTTDEVEQAFEFSHGPGFGTLKNASEMDTYVQLYQLCDGSPHTSEPTIVTRKAGVDLEWIEKGLLVAIADEGNTLRQGFIWHPVKSCPRSANNPVKLVAQLDGDAKRRRVYFAPLDLVFKTTVAGFPSSYSPGYKGTRRSRHEIPFLFSYGVGAEEIRLVEGRASIVNSMAWNMCSARSAGCMNNILLVNETFRSLGSYNLDGFKLTHPSKEGSSCLDDLVRDELWMLNAYRRNVTHQFR